MQDIQECKMRWQEELKQDQDHGGGNIYYTIDQFGLYKIPLKTAIFEMIEKSKDSGILKGDLYQRFRSKGARPTVEYLLKQKLIYMFNNRQQNRFVSSCHKQEFIQTNHWFKEIPHIL